MNIKKLIALTATALASLSANAVPVQWAGNGHYYEFVSTGVDWNTARGNALASTHLGMQGYLATVTSAAEQTFLHALNAAVGWIGGADEWAAGEADDGIWKWMDGPEAGMIFFGPGAVVGAFTFWNAGEPNNCCNGEDYLQINWAGNGAWNDHGGPGNPGQLNGYFVEYSNVPEPGTLLLAGLGLAGLALGRRRSTLAVA